MSGKVGEWDRKYSKLPQAKDEMDKMAYFAQVAERTAAAGSERRRLSMDTALRGSVTQLHALAHTEVENQLILREIAEKYPTKLQQIRLWDIDGTFLTLLSLCGFRSLFSHTVTSCLLVLGIANQIFAAVCHDSARVSASPYVLSAVFLALLVLKDKVGRRGWVKDFKETLYLDPEFENITEAVTARWVAISLQHRGDDAMLRRLSGLEQAKTLSGKARGDKVEPTPWTLGDGGPSADANEVERLKSRSNNATLTSKRSRASRTWARSARIEFLVIWAALGHGAVATAFSVLNKQNSSSTEDFIQVALCVGEVGAAAVSAANLAHMGFLVGICCHLCVLEADELERAMATGVVDSWRSACLLARVRESTIERIRKCCTAVQNKIVSRFMFFAVIFASLLLAAAVQYFVSGILIPTVVPACFVCFALIWLTFVLNIGSVNVSMAKIEKSLHEEHMRILYQQGALSLSSGDFADAHAFTLEQLRLQSIADLVHKMELEPTAVAFMQGIVIDRQMIITIFAKLLLGLFLLSQYLTFFASSFIVGSFPVVFTSSSLPDVDGIVLNTTAATYDGTPCSSGVAGCVASVCPSTEDPGYALCVNACAEIAFSFGRH